MEEGLRRSKVGPWLPYLGTPVGALGFWLLHRAGLLGPEPFWLILALLASTAVMNGCAYFIAIRLGPGTRRLHLRLGLAAVTTTAILYATGWGPVIAIGYVLGVSDVLRTDGSEAWWRGALWSVGAIALGQLGVLTGAVPSVLPMHVSMAVAAANATCLVIVLYSLGTTHAAVEHATDEIATEREHFRSLVQHAQDIIAVMDRDLNVQYVSPAILPMLGLDPDWCVGRPVGELLGGGVSDRGRSLVTTLLTERRSITHEVELRHRDGGPRTVEITATAREDDAIVLNVHDVTQQRALEKVLRHQARHDTLTGLMNRAALIEAVEKHTIDAAIVGTISVLFVDLDGFKEVNDDLGHERGDAVLVEAASRILGAVPAQALTGRLGGDEFLVVLYGTPNDEAGVIAHGILEALERPWNLPGCSISASIGVATTGARRESVEDILRRADEAMYDAKRQGKGRFVLAAVS
jgi:diguanylate cyclase (GGDEF)-like protein/PAS domain S-box-containing protein